MQAWLPNLQASAAEAMSQVFGRALQKKARKKAAARLRPAVQLPYVPGEARNKEPHEASYPVRSFNLYTARDLNPQPSD